MTTELTSKEIRQIEDEMIDALIEEFKEDVHNLNKDAWMNAFEQVNERDIARIEFRLIPLYCWINLGCDLLDDVKKAEVFKVYDEAMNEFLDIEELKEVVVGGVLDE